VNGKTVRSTQSGRKGIRSADRTEGMILYRAWSSLMPEPDSERSRERYGRSALRWRTRRGFKESRQMRTRCVRWSVGSTHASQVSEHEAEVRSPPGRKRDRIRRGGKSKNAWVSKSVRRDGEPDGVTNQRRDLSQDAWAEDRADSGWPALSLPCS
jgi:hypothetical protein